MKLSSRLALLEDANRRLPPPPGPPRPVTDEEWLAAFEQWGAAGSFAHEPDFPVALAMFRDAITTAKAKGDPPFDPSADFLSDHRHPHIRLECWRARFPEVRAAYAWLEEMSWRLQHGIPPVSEAEFAELGAWFRANEDRLNAMAQPFDVGNGRRLWCSNVRYGLREGPRVEGAGQTAEDVRRLRARYPATG